MTSGYNPESAKAAKERLRKHHEENMRILEARRKSAAVPKAGSSLGFKIEKARARHRLKSQKREEEQTLRDVAAVRRKETTALRRTHQATERATAEQKLTAQVQKQHEALATQREAKRARLLTEQELRRARMKPYSDAATQVAKGAVAVGKSVAGGLTKLGEMGKEYHRTHPDADPFWGTPRKTQGSTHAPQSMSDIFGPRPSGGGKPRPIVDFNPDEIMR